MKGLFFLVNMTQLKNTWIFRKKEGSGNVYTNTVYTVDVRPSDAQIEQAAAQFEVLPLPNLDNLVTQQDVNWYFYELINSIDGGSQIWVGLDEPPGTDNENPITKFWWKDDEQQLYVWDSLKSEWVLTGLMDFDRPPIVGSIEPLEHPKFPGKALEQGDLWYNTSRLELFIYWNGAWFPTSAPSVGFDGVSTETFTYTVNRIYSLTDEIYLKNIQQDDRLDVLEENIVELEEEIDAIAPSNERGEWIFNPAGVASPGYYTFLDGSTQPTDRFDGAATIYVSTRDADNVTHSFNNHEAGEYLQIFNKEGDGYGLYQITDIDDNSSSPNPFFAFTVDFVQSLVTAPRAENRGRFKFFTIAEGDPGAYVLKTGDEMSGNLTLPATATADAHAIHKGYVDDKYAELLAKIEELEMASGQPENYRLRLQTKNYGSSSNIGDWLESNACFTSVTAPSAWKNLDIDAVSGQDGYFYVCFQDDTYSLNSTGTLHVIKEFEGSYSFYDSDRHVLALTVSNAEKCPDEYSNNKNIWRCNIQPDLYRSSYNESTLGAFSDREYLYVTFAGGSLTKVTP